jgi:hypothetical protein
MPVYEAKKSLTYLLKAIIITTIVVSLLGYIDFVTGEISLDILYLLCVCLVTWYTNTFLGFLCVLEIFVSKTTADYFCQIKVGTHLYEWNTLNLMVMYIIVSLLVSQVRKALTA